MILWHRREAVPLESKKKVNPRIMELQAAKELLAEIFHDKLYIVIRIIE